MPANATRSANSSKRQSISDRLPPDASWVAPPATLDDCFARIRVLGERITGYVRFMSAETNLTGTSNEVKRRGVELFYERLRAAERDLARVHEELRLQ
jgi:hypothetical protein